VDGRAPGLVDIAELNAAYAVCRTIARREAKNFYYAFVALPKPKRNAICAVYAFMRQADDLADDESVSVDERHKRLSAWIAGWRAASAGGETSDPVFIALLDAMVRFEIPLSLLDELVAGVTMDLDCANGNAPDTYATFEDLYKYCYLVASVVGLVCIRIFGYTDVRAEKLAEETGIAFQLTNILRDVAEDAERNRVYLPLVDLKAHGVGVDSASRKKRGSHFKGAGSAQRDRTAGGDVLQVGAGVDAAYQQREPAGAVGVGEYLSCIAEEDREGGLRCVLEEGKCAVEGKAFHSRCGSDADDVGSVGGVTGTPLNGLPSGLKPNFVLQD